MQHLINKLIVPATLLAVALAIACSQAEKQESAANEADLQAITKVSEQKIAAFSSGDINSLLALHLNSAVVMPPNEPALFGADAERAWLENLYKQFTVRGAYPASDIVVAGDWAFQRYAYTVTITLLSGGESIEDVGKGIHIYRRQADGSWKIAQDIWNNDKPLAAGQ